MPTGTVHKPDLLHGGGQGGDRRAGRAHSPSGEWGRGRRMPGGASVHHVAHARDACVTIRRRLRLVQ
ncbi:hypothetical protein DA2_3591 [Desulfovibrio sp. A2]|nr:hypothetical protein DA2_3591 [Desulfovibrio sp. A2]